MAGDGGKPQTISFSNGRRHADRSDAVLDRLGDLPPAPLSAYWAPVSPGSVHTRYYNIIGFHMISNVFSSAKEVVYRDK